jgi:hypothetical protein
VVVTGPGPRCHRLAGPVLGPDPDERELFVACEVLTHRLLDLLSGRGLDDRLVEFTDDVVDAFEVGELAVALLQGPVLFAEFLLALDPVEGGLRRRREQVEHPPYIGPERPFFGREGGEYAVIAQRHDEPALRARVVELGRFATVVERERLVVEKRGPDCRVASLEVGRPLAVQFLEGRRRGADPQSADFGIEQENPDARIEHVARGVDHPLADFRLRLSVYQLPRRRLERREDALPFLALDGRDGVAEGLPEFFEDGPLALVERRPPVGEHVHDPVGRALVDYRDGGDGLDVVARPPPGAERLRGRRIVRDRALGGFDRFDGFGAPRRGEETLDGRRLDPGTDASSVVTVGVEPPQRRAVIGVGGRETVTDRLFGLRPGRRVEQGLVDVPDDGADPVQLLQPASLPVDLSLALHVVRHVPADAGQCDHVAVLADHRATAVVVRNPLAVLGEQRRLDVAHRAVLDDVGDGLLDGRFVLVGDEIERPHLGDLLVGVARRLGESVVPAQEVPLVVERVYHVGHGVEDALQERGLFAEFALAFPVFGDVLHREDDSFDGVVAGEQRSGVEPDPHPLVVRSFDLGHPVVHRLAGREHLRRRERFGRDRVPVLVVDGPDRVVVLPLLQSRLRNPEDVGGPLVRPPDIAVGTDDADPDGARIEQLLAEVPLLLELSFALFPVGDVPDDADGAHELVVDEQGGDPALAGHRRPVRPLDGQFHRHHRLGVFLDEVLHELAPFVQVVLVDDRRDVLAEQFVAAVATDVLDCVVQGDETAVPVELVDTVTNRVDDGVVPLPGFRCRAAFEDGSRARVFQSFRIVVADDDYRRPRCRLAGLLDERRDRHIREL